MANEFKVRKGLVINGSGSALLEAQGSVGQLSTITDSLSGSLFSVNDISGIPVLEAFSNATVKIGAFGVEAIKVSGSFATVTGSLRGTASYAVNALSASNALSSSYALSASFAPSIAAFPYTGSAQITGSLGVIGSISVLGSVINNLTASFATNVIPITSKTIVIGNNNYIQPYDTGSFVSWRVPYPITASSITAFSTSSLGPTSGSQVNVNKNNSLLLAVPLAVTTSTWVSSSTLQNQNFNIGDVLGFNFLTLTGSLTQIIIQVDFIK